MNSKMVCTLVGWGLGLALARADEPKAIEERDALPKPGGEPTLRVDVRMPRTAWGEWEVAHFDFHIVNATQKPIAFEHGDPGRGFAGKVLYLRDSNGKIRAFGQHWAAPLHYRPNFWGRPEKFEPGAVVLEQTGLEPAGYFGSLGVGKHTLQVVVPDGRMKVDGKLTLQLASKPFAFEVVALTPNLRQKMEVAVENVAGISLEPTARAVTPNKNDRSIKLKLVNGSKDLIRFPQYLGMDLAPTEAEFFGGDGRWHKESLGWCGTGLLQQDLAAKQSANLSTYVPTDKAGYVRFKLSIAVDGKRRDVVSPVIELKKPGLREAKPEM